MKPKLFIFIIIIISIIAGCYHYDSITVKIDLKSKTGEIVLKNIFSVPYSFDSTKTDWTEEDIQNDWNDFIDDYQNDSIFEGNFKITSKKLYEKRKELNARFRFSYETIDQLKFLEITLDNHAVGGPKYILKKDKEISYHNGKEIEEIDGEKYIVWDINAETIEITETSDISGEERYSLLPYWKKWVKQNSRQ